MPQIEFLTALSAFPYFGPVRLKLLLDYFGDAKKIWSAAPDELSKLGIPVNKISEFNVFRQKFNIKTYFEKLEKYGITPLSLFSDGYPENLKNIENAPLILYVRGKILPSDSMSVAIVGTRAMTAYGKDTANSIASGLSRFGVTIISGLALGIDGEAQRSAISSGGRTIAVLPTGLDKITPLTNIAIAKEILKGKGALVSEYPLGHSPHRSDFAVRNRLISGLSRGVVVIEGKMKSGTFHTVRAAAEQGRTVFAVPGPVNSPFSEAPNYLIQNGAKLVTRAEDIVEELGIEVRSATYNANQNLSKEESEIITFLSDGQRHLDELVRISGVKTPEVSARLTIMEMKGLVKNLGGSIFKKV